MGLLIFAAIYLVNKDVYSEMQICLKLQKMQLKSLIVCEKKLNISCPTAEWSAVTTLLKCP